MLTFATSSIFLQSCSADSLSADQDVKIGYKTRPSGSGTTASQNAYARGRAVGAITDNNRKAAAGHNKGHEGVDHARLAKLDRENEVTAPPKVAPSVGKTIGQARQAKGFNQKELGTKVNEKPQVIGDYESGRAVPNAQILSKLERALGVKLRGKDIGAPLGGPKKKT